MAVDRDPDPYCRIPTMRLPGVEDLDPELEDRIARGADPLEVRQMGWAPEHYKRFTDFQTRLWWKGEIEMPVKEAARLRIARLNQCHY